MKRLALALLLLAQVASAKVLVINSRNNFLLSGSPEYFAAEWDATRGVIQTLSTLGVDYDVISVSNSALKTEYCRTGTFVYDFGTPAARTVTYSAIVHCGFSMGGSTAGGRGFRADSLTLVGASSAVKYVAVPHIFLSYNGIGFAQSASCSTFIAHIDMTNNGNLGQTMYVPGTTTTYRAGVAKSFLFDGPTGSSWPGGYRNLLRAATGIGIMQSDGGTPSPEIIPRPWGDSLFNGFVNTATPFADDTSVVFVKMFNNIPSCNGAVEVFVQPADNDEAGRDHVPFLAALAYVDSLTSGGIFNTAKKVPLKLGLQIRGGFSRGTKLGWPTSTGGMTTTDSVAFKASIDSIAALQIPFVVGVNVDSIGTYMTTDGRWWARAPMAHYGVYQTTGVTDTTRVSADGGVASFQRPRDIFGLWRNRLVAVGPDGVAGDSSISTLVRGAFWKMDSTFGSYRVDRILMAPNDDWSPKNASSMWRDSVIYAMSKGGAKGLTVNPYLGRLRGVGYSCVAENNPILLGPTRGPFKLLVTAGYRDSGSTTIDVHNGTTANPPPATKSLRPNFSQMERNWRAALTEKPSPYGIFEQDSLAFIPGSARIVTVHAADLGSGLRGDNATLPLRPAWVIIKNMANGMAVVNKFAYRGRKIVMFDYPDNIQWNP